jgi:hypothetical protein
MDTPNLLRPQDVLPRVESQGRRTLLRYVACRLSTRPGLPEDAVHVGRWDVGRMANVEELPPRPFLGLLGQLGLSTHLSEAGDDRVLLFP